jgi:short-subunit dehydrogenase involved in D-alanine esterification of teichoic acids
MKYILLVGASGGIGNVVAEKLLSLNYEVIGTFFQHPQRVTNLNNAKNFSSFHIDIRDSHAIQALYDQLDEKQRQLYAVINCSGMYVN